MHTAASDRSSGQATGVWVPWILRIGTAACFIGHGALGVLRTEAWIPYFAVAGMGRERALALMPLVGTLDVAMGLLTLVRPIRAVVLYMAVWGLGTALLRPLAGEPVWEAVERAGNYGAPLALVLLGEGGSLRAWYGGGLRAALTPTRLQAVGWVLRLTTVLLLLGHGALQLLVCKPMFATQYAFLGLPGPASESVAGGVECLLALAVLLRPDCRLLLAAVAWKLATEALCPLTGSPFWVFIEHGGSYAAPLALALLAAARVRAGADIIPSPTSQPQAPA